MFEVHALANLRGGRGDCFVLRDDSDARLVVDVGHANAGRRAPWADVVVLTHQDDDHISGASIYLTKASPRTGYLPSTGELWVPYEWAVIVRELAWIGSQDKDYATPQDLPLENHPEQIAELLARTRAAMAASRGEAPDPFNDTTLNRLLGDVVAEEPHLGRADRNDERDLGNLGLARALEQVRGMDLADVTAPLKQAELRAAEAISGAKRVKKEVIVTALNGIHRTIKVLEAAVSEDGGRRLVKFFDYRPTPVTARHHKDDLARIVNADMIQVDWTIPGKGTTALRLAAYLTIQNRRSLVVYAPNPRDRGKVDLESRGGAIFWADSSGEFCEPPNSLPKFRVATAPHHGSSNLEHNHAWAAIRTNGRETFLLCSHNSAVGDPVTEHLRDHPPCARDCTWRFSADGKRTTRDAGVIIDSSRHWGYGCHHSSCHDRTDASVPCRSC
jgi:hypothetical protein